MFEILIADKRIDFEKIKGNVAYIITKSGYMIYRKTEQFESLSPVDDIPLLRQLDGYCKIRNIKKIPSYLLARALNFFKEVYNKYKSEAGVLITYNRVTKTFGLECPEQEVSGASLDWKMDKVIYPKNVCVAGTIHSHADFGAFHSGTDDGDEKDVDGIHITLGKVNSEPEIACSYVAGGQRVTLTQKDVAYDCKGNEKFPKAWLDRVKEKRNFGFVGSQSTIDYRGYDDYGIVGYGLQSNFPKIVEVKSDFDCGRCRIEVDTDICVRCDQYQSKEYWQKKYPKTQFTDEKVITKDCSPQGCSFFPPDKSCGDKCRLYKGRKWRRQKEKWFARMIKKIRERRFNK